MALRKRKNADNLVQIALSARSDRAVAIGRIYDVLVCLVTDNPQIVFFSNRQDFHQYIFGKDRSSRIVGRIDEDSLCSRRYAIKDIGRIISIIVFKTQRDAYR